MKSGKWTITDNSSQIWPLGGDCKFQFEDEIDFQSKSFDQLTGILEHFCVGKDGKSRLKSSLTARTVIRVEGHVKGTSAFGFVRSLKKAKMAAK
jgi:hypothetical protein